MPNTNILIDRSNGNCELCSTENASIAYTVPPKTGENAEDQILVCQTCADALENNDFSDTEHWRALRESIWSEVPAVQVVSYRILQQLSSEEWAADTISMVYLDEPTKDWAEAGGGSLTHKDSNGQTLQDGDSVLLIKDLPVKGANFTAKKGTLVKNIRLDPTNPTYIEGKVNGQQIVIITDYVKKTS